eukprot:m.118745 g.118745  ORF g.118745 m.118745 type:complete len:270 (-) comp19520_c0_seq3:33-842(-)
MDVSTADMLSDGFQAPAGGIFKTSRQIRPAVSMFGWYTFVMNRAWGGSKGNLSGTTISRRNMPPAKAVPAGPTILASSLSTLSPTAQQEMPGGGSRVRENSSFFMRANREPAAIPSTTQRHRALQSPQWPVVSKENRGGGPEVVLFPLLAMSDPSAAPPEDVPAAAAAPAKAQPRPQSVVVVFKAAAGAPQLVEKNRKIKVKTSIEFKAVVEHLQKLLKQTSIFCYVSMGHIAPALDETLENLVAMYGRFSSAGAVTLGVDYAVTPAWG